MHTVSWPDLLVVMTMLLTQVVRSSTLDGTPRFSNRFNSPLNLPLSAAGILRGGVTTGWAVLSTCRCTCPGRVPSSFENTSSYFLMKSFFMETLFTLLGGTVVK